MDLSKNVGSVLLPYLDHPDLLHFETTNKKAYVLANYFPVWKNVFEEVYLNDHVKKDKIPIKEIEMTRDEKSDQNFKAACKRGFLYLKEKYGEEIPEEIFDYTMGITFVILDELSNSLSEVPELILHPANYLEKALALVCSQATKVYDYASTNMFQVVPRVFTFTNMLLFQGPDFYTTLIGYNHVSSYLSLDFLA